jgi:mycothiol synthase
MRLTAKQCETSNDDWRLREFFRTLRLADSSPGAIWDVANFDYWRWHYLENVVGRPPTDLRYWETPEKRIVAVLIQGDPGVCHPMVDPRFATAALLHEMMAVAESGLSLTSEDGRTTIYPWSDERNLLLNAVLEARGYVPASGGHATEYNGWTDLSDPLEVPHLPKGYLVRSMGDIEALPARSLASWRVHHPGEPDERADPTGEWYRAVQRAPLYRRDLDVVAVEETSGDIVAFSTCYFDDVTRTGTFVLTGAVPTPPHQALEGAAIVETLPRLRRLGAEGAYLSWFESDPGSVYESAGFACPVLSRAWKRVL